MPRQFIGTLHIEPFHAADRRKKIDLLILSAGAAIVVECKVRDSQKPYQLEYYRNYIRRTFGVDPVLVWLVQRPQQLLGTSHLSPVVITWNDLRNALVGSVAAMRNTLVKAFVSELESAGISLPAPPRVRSKRHKGYDPGHASEVLLGIAQRVPGATYRIRQDNETEPALHIGMPEWDSIFGDAWVQRVWIYIKPLSAVNDRIGHFFLQFQILVYHAHESATGVFDLGRARQLLDFCAKERMVVWRNRPGKWRYREPLIHPWRILPPVNYVYGEETAQAARAASAFDFRDTTAATENGAARIRALISRIAAIGT